MEQIEEQLTQEVKTCSSHKALPTSDASLWLAANACRLSLKLELRRRFPVVD